MSCSKKNDGCDIDTDSSKRSKRHGGRLFHLFADGVVLEEETRNKIRSLARPPAHQRVLINPADSDMRHCNEWFYRIPVYSGYNTRMSLAMERS